MILAQTMPHKIRIVNSKGFEGHLMAVAILRPHIERTTEVPLQFELMTFPHTRPATKWKRSSIELIEHNLTVQINAERPESPVEGSRRCLTRIEQLGLSTGLF